MSKYALSTLVLLVMACVGASAEVVSATSNITITNYSGPSMYLFALSEPFTFNGTCPKDVRKITANYYVPKPGAATPEASSSVDLSGFTLIESYVLQKYVPGSGAFIYRIHPDLNNLRDGTNLYVIVAERSDSTKLIAILCVMYSPYAAERGGPTDEEMAPAAERGGPGGEYYGERGGDGGESYAERGGDTGESGGPSAAVPPVGAARSSPGATPSASGLQAGYADDNDQFNYFVNFLDKYSGDVPHADIPIQERIVLKVTDQAGKPVPNAKVSVSAGTAPLTTGLTYADGTFLFFPSEYDSKHTKFTATISALNRTRDIVIDKTGKREVQAQLPSARPKYQNVPLDILFILDTTGSMQEEIERLKATIDIINLNLASLSSKPKIRFGMVLYRDRGDKYITRIVPFTASLDDFRAELSTVTADGGGDDPEDLQAALADAMHNVAWNVDGIRLAFVITDAPPHLDYSDETYKYVDAAHDAARKGIKIFTVGAGGLDLAGELVLRQISQYTYAKYIFLTYGERGESAGGAPGSVSHHTGANFTTDKLEAIVIRFAKEELSYLTETPVNEEADYFQAVKTGGEAKSETLSKLFDQAISQVIDYASIGIPQGTPTAALPIVAQAGASAPDAEYFGEQLVLSLARNTTFAAVERKNLQAIMKELELQMSGITNEANAAKLGKVMGAKMLLSSTMFDRGDNFEIFMRLLRVETGEIISVTRLVVDKQLGLKGK